MLIDIVKVENVDNMKVEIITFVIQLRVKFVFLAYDECQVQVVCLVIQSI